jgi:hypothetical protein
MVAVPTVPNPFISKFQTFQKLRIIPEESRTGHSLWNRGSIPLEVLILALTLLCLITLCLSFFELLGSISHTSKCLLFFLWDHLIYIGR